MWILGNRESESVVKKEPLFDLIIQHDFIQISCTDVTWLILRRSDFKIYKLITSKNDTVLTDKSNQTINDDNENNDTYEKGIIFGGW